MFPPVVASPAVVDWVAGSASAEYSARVILAHSGDVAALEAIDVSDLGFAIAQAWKVFLNSSLAL